MYGRYEYLYKNKRLNGEIKKLMKFYYVNLCNRSVQILSYLPIKHIDDKYIVDMSSNIPTVFPNEQYIGLYMDLALHLLPSTLKLRSLQSCKYRQHLSPSMCLIVELPKYYDYF